MSVSETRCRMCGATLPRIRAGFIGVLCLVAGLGFGRLVMMMLHL